MIPEDIKKKLIVENGLLLINYLKVVLVMVKFVYS